ncbi:MAG: XRE family transcriptional regulator [Gemmatimonadetes bacterium]|nr:XRE family transcriptional regulator [Gemmatimonadota bacterium]
MAGHTPWRQVRDAKLNREQVEQIKRDAEAALFAMELNDLRRARNITQEELADRLGTRQSNVSRLERRRDVRLSTLRDVIEAMGGELQVIAHFPDADYRIDQYERVAEAAD